MNIHDKGRTRFARRPPPRSFSALALSRGGLEAAEELARGCRGGLAQCLPKALVPEPIPDPRALARGKSAKRLSARGVAKTFLMALLLLHLFWIGTTSLLIISYKFIQPSATVLMAYRAWTDGWKIALPRPLALRTVPLWVRSMVLSIEDYKFYEHHGFDFEAIKRAYEINKRLDEPLYGGSTLTMQVARTLFLVPEKSYLRKYLEVIVAAELEVFLGKDRIFELYFGYAEWGKGIFGIDAAARKWYGAGVRGITRDQGARLVAILSSPIKYRPEWFGKSLILKERYEYLYNRYVAPPPADDVSPSGNAAPADASVAADAAAAAATASALSATPEAGQSAGTPVPGAP